MCVTVGSSLLLGRRGYLKSRESIESGEISSTRNQKTAFLKPARDTARLASSGYNLPQRGSAKNRKGP